MLQFDFQSPTRIVFGEGKHRDIGALLKPYAKKVLLHYGGGSIKKTGLYDDIVSSLNGAGVAFAELSGVQPNPRVTLVREGIDLCRRERVELILAVGGGSVIDSAKAISLGLGNPELDVWDIFARALTPRKGIPVVTVLTLPAAGSEASNSCVISNVETGQKYGCNGDFNRPLLSVIDPLLFTTLPKRQIANGVTDMLTHVMERYFTNTAHTELIDGLCETTMRTILDFGKLVYENPADCDAWAQLSLAGTLAHCNLLGVGREQDWASHKLEHELSARYDIAHGAGLAVVFPAWMRYCMDVNPGRFSDFAVRVMRVAPAGSALSTAERGIAALESYLASIGQPSRVSEFGADEAAIADMARRAVTNGDGSERRVGFYKRLYVPDIEAIYRSVL